MRFCFFTARDFQHKEIKKLTNVEILATNNTRNILHHQLDERTQNFFTQLMVAIKGTDKNINFVIVRGEPGTEHQEKAGNITLMNWAEDRCFRNH